MSPLVILAPLLPEAQAFARAFSLPTTFKNRLESNNQITIACIGLRAKHLDFMRNLKPRALILAGLAGALDPTLKLGDLVSAAPLNLPNLHHGTIHTSPSLIATPAQKAALFRQTRALAVDMESAPVHTLAASLNIPCITLRAISDTAADALDPAFLTFIDPDGRPKLSAALAHLVTHPSKLPSMLHIRKATNLALSNLSAALRQLVESNWPSPSH